MGKMTRLTIGRFSGTAAEVRQATFGAAALALLIGSLLLYGVGFAGAHSLHNAAHDGRHSMAFPCH
jgi:cobalt transporter subunit CbtB